MIIWSLIVFLKQMRKDTRDDTFQFCIFYSSFIDYSLASMILLNLLDDGIV